MKFPRFFLTLVSLLASAVAAQTVTYTFPIYGRPDMNYGLCVKGASYASATSTSWDLEYDMVSTNFGNGVRLWGDSGSISKDVDGTNNDCKGGIYLQPSNSDDWMMMRMPSDKATIVATAAAGMTHVEICAFVFERRRRGGKYSHGPGDWVGLLKRDGFDSTKKAFGWSELDGRWPQDGGRTLCKNFEVKVDDAPAVLPRPITYTFPSMGDNKIAHGLCVKGAHIASATNTRGIEYSVGSVNFKRHVPLWGGGAPYDAVDLDLRGTENDNPCLGGIYLQPNIKDIPLASQGVPDSTNVQIIPASEESTVLLCALLTKDEPSDSMGNWKNLPKTDGFTEYPESFGVMPYYKGTRYTKPGWTYCKEMSPSPPTSSPTVSPTEFPTTLSPTSFPTDGTEDIVRPTNDSLRRGTDAVPNGSTNDIRVLRTVGTTEFPLATQEVSITHSTVNILSSNRTTVTVDLIQAWYGHVDNFFYVYKAGHFSSHCYEKKNLEPLESIDTITLRCNVLSPTASLYVCVEDRNGNLLGMGDKASVPHCCESDAPEDTPTVCYHLEIACEREVSTFGRNLRSIDASSK